MDNKTKEYRVIKKFRGIYKGIEELYTSDTDEIGTEKAVNDPSGKPITKDFKFEDYFEEIK